MSNCAKPDSCSRPLRRSALSSPVGRLPDTPTVSFLAVPDDIELTMPALWEHKALNAKNFKAVERDGLSEGRLE